ncbi:ATPase [Simiduia sp. 21SJ11W-1]|uniref:BadF/BadG/BcrA/BcrD ATPase family protein n=1 Tax=Simiduia sp. 21SJ11W-1 TaxID=2909669 RepID=UPI00209D9BFE|nr:BadF/BadG/BcrA/BcrD ATPase family protein [Simiduia sp. 21SJ11W-1]UTA48416.1 ATPase [Simiduia sp. 21SJ11W-1]
MSHYYLGVDGGATKCVARLCNSDGTLCERRAGAASLTNDLTQAIATVQDVCHQLLTEAGLTPEQVHLAAGLAGAGKSDAAQAVHTALTNAGYASVHITTDAQTSLLGAGAGEPMVMVAVGTGSVAMRLSADGKITQVGGWGLAVGDEGSGAAVGKSAVRALLWELDLHGEPQTKLSRHVVEQVGRERAAILRWLSQAGPKEYAALAPAVFEFLPYCPLAQKIARKTASEVEQLIRAASGDQDLPITLLGGLAQNMSDLLSPDLRAKLVAPKGTALDGACTLARQRHQFS